MPSSRASEVIADPNQIIQQVFPFSDHTIFEVVFWQVQIRNIVLQVKAFNGKVNQPKIYQHLRAYLFWGVLLTFKPLQAKHEYLWSLIYFHLLFGKHKLLALRTKPCVIFAENLLFLEWFQAIVNRHRVLAWGYAFWGSAVGGCERRLSFLLYLIEQLLNLFFVLAPI